MYPDPMSVRLIHDEKVNDALERHGPDHLRRAHEPFLRPRWSGRSRHATARTIYKLADRIDPVGRGRGVGPHLRRIEC